MDQRLTTPSLETEVENWLPLVPEIGLLWQF